MPTGVTYRWAPFAVPCLPVTITARHGLVPATGQGGSLAVLDSTGGTFAYLTCRKNVTRIPHELQ